MINKSGSAKMHRKLFILMFTIPTFSLFCIFTVYPMLSGLYISLFDWSGYSQGKTFIGFANYVEMIQDSIVGTAIFNDYFLVFWKVIFIMVIATFLAVSLTRFRIRRTGFFRVIFFFPNIISVVIIGILWRFIYNPNMGVLNGLLNWFSDEPVQIAWLGDGSTAMWSILAPAVWAGIGFYMILLIAAILSIPSEIYEASNIDGAGQWRQFVTITIPLTWEQMKVSILHIVMTTLNGSFILVWLMTEGGPNNETQVMGSYLYQMGFRQYHMGYAAAIGVLILLLSFITTLLLHRLMKRDVVQM